MSASSPEVMESCVSSAQVGLTFDDLRPGRTFDGSKERYMELLQKFFKDNYMPMVKRSTNDRQIIYQCKLGIDRASKSKATKKKMLSYNYKGKL